MRNDQVFDGIPIFITVVESASFTAAATRLSISPSAVSQAISGLERRLGLTLFLRSTRSLKLTPAGRAYYDRARPAFASLVAATQEAMGRATEPAGPLRLTMPRAAYDGLVGPNLLSFRAAFPAIDVDIDIDGRLVDIMEQGFDAGLRYGSLVADNMVAIKVFPASRSILCAAPAYIESSMPPVCVADLRNHRTVVCRSRTSGLMPPWILQGPDGRSRHDPQSPMVAGDLATQIDLAIRGHGITLAPIQCLHGHIDDGRLVPLLEDWSSPLEALSLYYPSRKGKSAALGAFIDHLRQATQPGCDRTVID